MSNKDNDQELGKTVKSPQRRNELKELQSIRNLLILQLLKNGATSEEVNLATGMGSANIRRMFPNIKKKGKSEKAQ